MLRKTSEIASHTWGVDRNLYIESLLKGKDLPSVDSKNLYRFGSPLKIEVTSTERRVNTSTPERLENLALAKRERTPICVKSDSKEIAQLHEDEFLFIIALCIICFNLLIFNIKYTILYTFIQQNTPQNSILKPFLLCIYIPP